MDYSKYGISESYMPTVYHNRIVIDKTTAATVNKNLTENAYIQGTVGSLGKVTATPVQTLVTVDYNIVFNVPNYSEFVNLTKDNDFGDSFIINSFICWKDPNIEANSQNIISSNFPLLYAEQLEDLGQNINQVTLKEFSLQDVFKEVANDSLNLSKFDNFTRYQRTFPDGQKYFQVPYSTKFFVPRESVPFLYLVSYTLVKDFDIDLNLNFGNFQINDDEITAVSVLDAYNLGTNKGGANHGPLTVDSLIYNNNVQTKGVFYTIAQNQSTYQGQIPEGVNLQEVTGSDILREEKFNDLKGTPWLGGVHAHEGRYMAGSIHTTDTHPYLDANVVLNKKLIDLRPIKEVKEQKLNLTPILKNIKSTKINYFSDNSKKDLLEKLTIISDPLLSVKREISNGDEHIDGFFAVNYTNFLRKHSVFSGLIENQTMFQRIFENNLTGINIKIFRHDVKTSVSKLVYDSSRAELNGTFKTKPSLETQQFSGDLNKIDVLLGYLSVVNLDKNTLDVDTQASKLEFYTFTDVDKSKSPDTEYKYEIEVEMNDPVFDYLSNGIAALDKAIRGDGLTLGLQQVLEMLKTSRGETNIVSGGKNFPYVIDDINQEVINPVNNSTIVDLITQYDIRNGTESLTSGDNPKLVLLEDLYKSEILLAIGSNTPGLLAAFSQIVNNIVNLEDAGGISIDLFRLVINTLSSIRDNLKNGINAISNVDITTQSFGYRAPTVSSQNGNSSKRIIKEKIMSDTSIKSEGYGFDYLQIFNDEDNIGLRQLTVDTLKQTMDTVYLPKFYDTEQSDSYSLVLNTYLANYGYSTLTLTKDGVVLPKGLFTASDYKDWSNLLQFLLLYIEKNASKLTETTTFTYTQNDSSDFKFDINKNILGLSIVNDENIGLLKSLDRGQKQLSSKGLSIQDEIKTNQSIFVEYSEEIQTDQKDSQSSILVDNLKRNNISDYFLNYVNNAVENGNQNKNKDLDGVNALALSPTADPRNQTIPVISLVEYYNEDSDILGEPEQGVSYREYYENVVWSPETKKLFLDRFADFFFDFVNSVKIEYLSSFDTYTYVGVLDDAKQSQLDQSNNIDISSNNWTQLTNSVLDNLENGQAILCKMVDFVPDAFATTNIPLIHKLKFYKKYYNYFLIIKGQKDLQIRAFGSTV